MRRVMAAEGLVLAGQPAAGALPDWLEWEPNRVWASTSRIGPAPAWPLSCGVPQLAGHAHLAEGVQHPGRVAFLVALEAEGLLELADQRATEALPCRAALRRPGQGARPG